MAGKCPQRIRQSNSEMEIPVKKGREKKHGISEDLRYVFAGIEYVGNSQSKEKK